MKEEEIKNQIEKEGLTAYGLFAEGHLTLFMSLYGLFQRKEIAEIQCKFLNEHFPNKRYSIKEVTIGGEKLKCT